VRQQLSIVEDGVNNAARRYNDLKVLCDRKAAELKEKLDDLDSLKLDHDAMQDMKQRNTFEAQRIDQLKMVSESFCGVSHESNRKQKRLRMTSFAVNITEGN
jgi:hypothetical protein